MVYIAPTKKTKANSDAVARWRLPPIHSAPSVGYNLEKKEQGRKKTMRSIVIAMLACVASPALADAYRCNAGGKTIYQDTPCPNAKLIDNGNSPAPSRLEQTKAMERAAKERTLAERLSATRAAETPSITSAQTTVRPNPAPQTNRPDRYYDRPDRYNSRSTSSSTTIQRQ
jgi:hypothetical protein